MLSVTGHNHFYYVRDFTDMRCKHSRVLSIIRERLHREPCDGDVFIVMSRNQRMALVVVVLTDFLSDEELMNIMSDRYNAYVFIGDELKSAQFKDTIHQVCMSYAPNKIDNNLAKRTIRKLTTQRNNSLHYGSDAGAEMAAAYHSVIGTVKLYGYSIWNFIGTYFKNLFNGYSDYVNIVLDKITLSTRQC